MSRFLCFCFSPLLTKRKGKESYEVCVSSSLSVPCCHLVDGPSSSSSSLNSSAEMSKDSVGCILETCCAILKWDDNKFLECWRPALLFYSEARLRGRWQPKCPRARQRGSSQSWQEEGWRCPEQLQVRNSSKLHTWSVSGELFLRFLNCDVYWCNRLQIKIQY